MKKKRQRFAETATFPNFFQPSYHEVLEGFPLRGKWGESYFRNPNPIVLELGCGKGEYTVGLARKHPEKNYIGVDRKGARMWRGARTAMDDGMFNTCFLRTQVELLEKLFAPGEISEIWITFPDPQAQKSRTRKRLTSPAFLKKYLSIAGQDAIIHLKTDSAPLFDYTLQVIGENGHGLIYQTRNLYASGYTGEVAGIHTFYEMKFLEKQKPICYLAFTLNPVPETGKTGDADDSFFQRVFRVARMIPYGRVTSYGAIAQYLGTKSSARMVGWAMNKSHTCPDEVPAHRVVNRNGMLTGKHHFGGPQVMQQLLENEGVVVVDDRIVNFRKIFWDPGREL